MNEKEALLNLLTDRPIAYHPVLAKAFKSVNAALFLSQLIYWHGKGKLGEWTYKTANDFYDELGMTQKEQVTARKILKSCGVIQEKLRGVPPTVHYKIIVDVLIKHLYPANQFSPKGEINLAQKGKSISTFGGNQFSPKGENISEITPKTTAETTEEEPKNSVRDPLSPIEDTMSGSDRASPKQGTHSGTLTDEKHPENGGNPKPKKRVKDKTLATALTVIAELNQLLGTSFRPTTDSTLKHINARLAEGFTVDDLLAVVQSRVELWKADPKMADYLRPSTLFNSEKFEGYLQVARKPLSEDEEFAARVVAAMARKEAEERLAEEENDAYHG